MALTSDPRDPRLTHGADTEPVAQAEVYLVLSEDERGKGFVRPVRRSYWHTTCGRITTMGLAIAETYARDPGWAFVWVASIALLMIGLTGCTPTDAKPNPSPAPAPVAQCDGCLPNHLWAASGEECTRIGAKAIGRKGGTLLCKPAPASNIAVGDNAPRWRKA